MIDDETLILMAYVDISKYRRSVINTLTKEYPLIPTEISKKTGIINNHISMVLNELKEKDLITCLNPTFRKGKLYTLTPKGEKVQKLLKKRNKERYILTNGTIKDTYTLREYHNLNEIVTLLNEQ